MENDQKDNQNVDNISKNTETILKELFDLKKEVTEVRKDIENSIVPKFTNISPQAKDLVELAIELWRLESRIKKFSSDKDKEQEENMLNSISKMKRYLDKNDIEIVDYTNKNYNQGINVEILAVEKDYNINEPIIKETKEPTILHKGQVINRGKVIILEKENKKEEISNEQ